MHSQSERDLRQKEWSLGLSDMKLIPQLDKIEGEKQVGIICA